MITAVRRFIPNWAVNYSWHWPKAAAANVIYGFPSRKLKIIGITGTKGKTSVTHLIYHILKEAGYRTVLISTISAKFGEREIDTGLHVTNPNPFQLQKLLKQAVNEGFEYIVMEVTSNGLDQFRDWGIKFKLGVFTQITSDHLDYHGSLEKYRQAKARLIEMSEKVLINKDDPARDYLVDSIGLPAGCHPYFIYCGKKDDFISQNEAAAIAAAREIGISEEEAKNYLKTFPGVAGRMEMIQEKPFRVIIDFAHTPDSLRAALKQLRRNMLSVKKLIAVFGCAGERDHGRRKMGAVAAELADFMVITAEDPRSESVEEISDEIEQYARATGALQGTVPYSGQVRYLKIPDRQKAINFAINIAKPGDVVGLFGKGHEKSMCFDKIEKPWSEYLAVKKALESK